MIGDRINLIRPDHSMDTISLLTVAKLIFLKITLIVYALLLL
uniref:Uncharacterized protein n=1 Tax=Arundo donax TaxID=35708 RepID=A0A0A9FUJ5_ARUDO